MTRRAFTLMEMLVVIVLLGVFGLVASRLTTASARSLRDTPRATDAANRLDATLRAIRRDAWSARRLDAAGDGAALSVVRPDGTTVEWRVTAGGDFARSDDTAHYLSDEPPTTWPGGAARSPRFVPDPAGVTLAWDGGGEVIVCPLQLRSAGAEGGGT